MKVIVVGGGRTGYHLAKSIPRSVIVEKDEGKLERLGDLVGVRVVQGDAADENVLINAGIHNADVVIIVTADDETNYEVSKLSKKYGVRNIISRVENPDNEKKFKDLKINAILCPTRVVADYIKAFIHPKTAKDFFLKKILVPIIGPQTMESAFEEALQISLRTDAELLLIGDKQEYLGEESKMVKLLDVPASLVTEEGDMVPSIEKHIEGADLVVVDPEELTYFEKILKKSLVRKLLGGHDTPILVSRTRKPYSSTLLLLDKSRASETSFKYARLFGEIFTSKTDSIVLEESEDLKEELENLIVHGESSGFEVEKKVLEGNIHIEVIKKVKSDEYDLIIIPWGDTTFLKNDVVEAIIDESKSSILIVKG